ncbi:MAG: VWA domain-containing protein [Hyphomicrobiaceae bacterium]|nr:VWA domain-containing protein [Hyphomicrobiaceae bacterium]
MLFVQNSMAHKFHNDERGTVVVMFGLIAVMIAMFAALAIDLSRVNHERSRVSNALDAAALAAGKALLNGNSSDSDIQQIARSFFNQNMKVAERFGTIINIDVAVDRASNGVKITATVEVPMTLARIGGFDKFTFPVVAQTSFEQNDIELSMALDVTGSMGGTGKLDALKAASNDLFDILLPDGGTSNKVRIALAPYSSGVNGGVYAALAAGATATRGCLFERENMNTISDDAPANGSYFKAIGMSGIAASAGCPPTSMIVPLTEDKSRLRSQVQAYTASGSTAGHLGVQWAWNMLSPAWGGIFTGPNAPTRYDDRKTNKVMILMTDGLFNTIAGRNDGDNSPSAARSQKLAVDMCTAMRDKGVTVYTVGFKLSEISSATLRSKAAQTLQDCAGSARNYFDADNANELRDAFAAIAEQINNLRLTN